MAKMASMMANRGQPIEQGEPVLLSAKTFDYATTIDMTDIDEVLRLDPPLTVGGWGTFELYNTTFMGWTVRKDVHGNDKLQKAVTDVGA